MAAVIKFPREIPAGEGVRIFFLVKIVYFLCGNDAEFSLRGEPVFRQNGNIPPFVGDIETDIYLHSQVFGCSETAFKHL